MTEMKTIWHDKHRNDLGCKRVSLVAGEVHLHERTAAGREDRDLDENAESVVNSLRFARENVPPGAKRQIEVDKWCCIFEWNSAWREHWSQLNSLGEPVQRAENMVPPRIKCRVLAEFVVKN